MSAAHEALDHSARRRVAFAGAAAGRLVVAALLPLLLATARAADDDDRDKVPPLPKESAELARKYAGVTDWEGYFEMTESGSGSWASGDSHGSELVENSSHGHFVLHRVEQSAEWDPGRGVFTWSGGGNRFVCGEQTVSRDAQHSIWHKSGRGEEMRWSGGGALPMTNTEFKLWLPNAKNKGHLVSVHPGGGLETKTFELKKTGRIVWDESRGNGTDLRRSMAIDETQSLSDFPAWYSPVGDAAGASWYQVARNGPGVLTFSYETRIKARGIDESRPPTPETVRRSRVILVPVYDDLEVEVTIAGYAKWRPEGSIEKPTEPGNSLVARATLKSKTGKVKELPAVKRFKFELLDTSREPGVCLNWPLEAKDQDYDLRLAAGSGGKLSDAGQKLSMTGSSQDDKGQPYAEAKVDSYDFGGRATLQVLCELEDGRELLGLIKGEGGKEDLVRLPKMNGPGWIADSWRKEHKAEKLTDNEDNEKVEGQKDNGDGFTLYEEYRGFAVRGRHVEGDPEKKDFFVLNLIGVDAQRGIRMLETAAELRIIDRLRPGEMSKELRLMNGNHAAAPHRVDQHGVWIEAFGAREIGSHGAATGLRRSGVAGRPGNTTGIGMPARRDPTSDFNKPFNLPRSALATAYDRAVAHELAHSLGALHHGRGDYSLSVRYLPAKDSNNPVGRSGLFADVDAKLIPIRVINEKSKKDFLATEGSAFERELALWSAKMPELLNTGDGIHPADMLTTLEWYLGRPMGQCSGNEQCLMRYYFAKVYPKDDEENALYWIPPGSEPVGKILCTKPDGTGVNDKDNDPQSRFFNAGTDVPRGNCFGQICPNDAIPPPPAPDGL